MKNTTSKYTGDDKGIAIIFSLIMLSVFFLISFGFVSMATSHKSAAKAREPQQQALLAANETVLNEALFAIEKGLMNGQTPNYAKFRDMKFINAADTLSVTLSAWSTKEITGTGSVDNASLNTALPLQVRADDFTPDPDIVDNPEWANVGWIARDDDGDTVTDYKYCWMVIDASGVDPNYIGGYDPLALPVGKVSGIREGHYIREIDIGTIDPVFRQNGTQDIYVNWTAATPTAWEDKKSLISGLTAQIETSITLFEPGTTPVTLTEQNSSTKYDLSQAITGTATDLHNSISWLSSVNSTESQRLACNIKDFIDEDNIASNIGSIYGKERVPYINEAHFKITNNTLAGSVGTPEPIKLEVEVTPELVKLLTVSAWGTGAANSHTGATATISLIYDILATKTTADAAVINATDQVITISQDLSSSLTAGYLRCNTGTHTENVSTGTSTSTSTNITVTIKLKEIRLTGNGTDVWDLVDLDIPATPPSQTAAFIATGAGNAQFVSFEAADCRNNHTQWTANAFSTSEAGTGSIISPNQRNTNYLPMDSEPITLDPWEISTAYMPEGGTIEHLAEVGMISRGTPGQTINLTDYNTQSASSFDSANYLPTGTLALETPTTFDGGDRALLDFVYIGNPGNKATADLPSYQQFGAINPNTTNSNVLKLLLTGVQPMVGPYKSPVASPLSTTIDVIIPLFPGIQKSANANAYFKVEDFHQTTGDLYHNRNPLKYEFPFSRKNSTSISTALLNDAQREALIIQTMNLVSPKYSYFTVIVAVDTPATSIYTLVRRDNQSGSYKILRKSTQ